MHLLDLLQKHPTTPSTSVPDWMLGCFRRRCISFADGRSDDSTLVFWLQSRNFTIDLRLPVTAEQAHAKPLHEYAPQELRVLANNEGWVADSVWANNQLSWQGGVSLQLHNRWPEPALLQRVGNCMMEFAPSNIYVEDWRLQPSSPGPLAGLRLIEEIRTDSGETTHRGGGLIICGEHAALVRGRAEAPANGGQLRDLAAAACGDHVLLASLFGFETSVARGNLSSGYTIDHSTMPSRLGQPLTALDGFSLAADTGEVVQTLSENDVPLRRRFSIDTLEAQIAFNSHSDCDSQASQWFEREAETLGRYLQRLS